MSGIWHPQGGLQGGWYAATKTSVTEDEDGVPHPKAKPTPRAKAKSGRKPKPGGPAQKETTEAGNAEKDKEAKDPKLAKHEQSLEDGCGVVLAAHINAKNITEDQIARLCESAQKNPASVIITGDKQPAKWAEFLRTWDPTYQGGMRGARCEKAPDDVVASMIQDAGTKKAWHPLLALQPLTYRLADLK